MREGWIHRIGDMKMPLKPENARICSSHFSKESFAERYNDEIKISQKNGRRRRGLLPHAVPTLNLKPVGEGPIDAQTMEPCVKLVNRGSKDHRVEYKVIRRQFILPVQKIFPDPELYKVGDIVRSNKVSSASLGLNPSVVRISKLKTQSLGSRASAIQKVKHTAFKETRKSCPDLNYAVKNSRPKRTSKNSKCYKKRVREYCSEDEGATWKQSRGVDNLGEPAKKTFKRKVAAEDDDDPYKTIEQLKADLKYHRSLSEFYRNSKTVDCLQYKDLKAECDRLGLEMRKKDDKDKRRLAEIKALKNLNTELYSKLHDAEAEKKRSKLEVDEMVRSVLKPYFTEGQIKGIIEKRKWVKWTVDDYAAAISLKSITMGC